MIATGKTNSLEEFINLSFSKLNLSWKDHVLSDPKLFRLTDLHGGKANPAKAEKILGWKAHVSLEQIIGKMIEAEL